MSIRIGCAVPDVALANTQKNVQTICDYIARAAGEGCNVLAFPELALTGATCGDLFSQRLLLTGTAGGLEEIRCLTAQYPNLTVVVGLPIMEAEVLHSCAAVLRDGEVLGTVHKGQKTHRVFSLPDGSTMAVVLGDEKIIADADIVVNPAAKIQLAGSRDRCIRESMARSENGLYVYCSAGWGESVTDGVYSGQSIIARNGGILAQNQNLADGGYLLWADSDGMAQPQTQRNISLNEKMPFITGYEDEIFTIQAAALASRLRLLNAKAVIGVSGGLDSTLALLVAVEAVQLLGRPATDVVAITMPGFGTTDRTYDNAVELMNLLGVTVREIPIRDAVRQHFADIGHDERTHDLTYENAQARERTQILMDYAGRVGGIVVGTGDLSELALGWCTYNGDHMSMYSVNASIPKTLIPEIIGAAAKLPRYSAAAQVLADVIATPISPQLLPPDEKGNITQQTEDVVGPYILHDFFLYHTLKNGTEPKEIFRMASGVFEEFDAETIKKWLKVFYRRFFTQQFKRSCMPEGVNATGISLSPRGDWQMPGDASAALWLAEVDRL